MAAFWAGVLIGLAKPTDRNENFIVRVLNSRRSTIFFLILSLRDTGFAAGRGGASTLLAAASQISVLRSRTLAQPSSLRLHEGEGGRDSETIRHACWGIQGEEPIGWACDNACVARRPNL